MPLPPALAARLAKRGIISKKAAKHQSNTHVEEEVFAESYDDHDDSHQPKRPHGKPNMQTQAEALEKIKFMGYPGCPNKWNVYHECSLYCQNHWGSGKSAPVDAEESEYSIKHKAVMAKYGPLPEDWKEMYDPGTGRHYYWCTRSDRVSWLPPGHPKAKITEAASQVREMIQSQLHMLPADLDDDEDDDDDEDEDDDQDDDDQAMDLDSDMSEDEDEEERRREERRRREKERKRGGRDDETDRHRSNKNKRKEAIVDPMDPSSYSDTPRGTWSSGLEKDDNKD